MVVNCIFSGYLIEVSPLKRSAKDYPYSNAVLETSSEIYQDVVVFAADKHQRMQQIGAARSPVKLDNVDLTHSRRDATAIDIKVTKRSTISAITRILDFAAKESHTRGYLAGDPAHGWWKWWCFRPLLCTLFRLNWAKQTLEIMRRN